MQLKEIEKEINEIKAMLQRIENMLALRLIGIDEPYEDELKEIQDYEKIKKEGKIKTT